MERLKHCEVAWLQASSYKRRKKKSFIMLMALLCWNLYQGCFKLNCPEVEIILLLWNPFSAGKCQSGVIHRWQRRNTPAATLLRVLPRWLKRAHKHGTHWQMAKSFMYMRVSVNASLEMHLGMLGYWACVWWWMWNIDIKIPEALLLSPKMLHVYPLFRIQNATDVRCASFGLTIWCSPYAMSKITPQEVLLWGV